MIINKTVCKIKQTILYLTFLSSQFIDIVLVTFVYMLFIIFVGIAFVTFPDTLAVAFIILSHIITGPSIVLATYSTFSRTNVLGFQM